MATPKVSVVMSVYNDEKYVREAIESILNQTFRDFEFIIINDGSTDGTEDVLQSYDAPRIFLLNNEKNIGLTKSLNKGIKMAQGQYIARIDGDDIAFPDRFEKQVRFLNEHPSVGLVSNSYIEINTAGEAIEFKKLPTDNDEIKRNLFNFERYTCFCHASSMFRRKCIERVGAYREQFKVSQDYDLWLRIVEEFEVANIEQPLCKVRIVTGSISTRKAEQAEYGERARSLAIQRQIFGEDELGYRPPGEPFRSLRQELSKSYIAKRKLVSNNYLMWSQKYFVQVGQWNPKKRREYLLKSLINNPLNLNAWSYGLHLVVRKTKNCSQCFANRFHIVF